MLTDRNFLKIVLLLLAVFYTRSSEAFEVAVLKSAQIRPYNEALDGFSSSCECSVDELSYQDIDDIDLPSRVRGLRADAVLAVGLEALNHAQLIKNIPVIYAMIPSLPPRLSEQKNISGVNMYITPEKYLGAMLDVFPNLRRIGVVYDPHYNDAFVKEALRIAQSRGVELVIKTMARAADAPALIDSLKDRIDVFWMLPDATLVRPEVVDHLLLFSFQNKVPVFTFAKKYVEMGALAGLNIVPQDIGAQTAEIARRLRNDSSQAPIRLYARKTVIMVNRKIASKLGVKIRDEVLKRAEDVY